MQLKYEITFPEFREMAWLRHRSSIRWITGICLSILGLALGLVFFVYTDHWLGIFLIAASVFLLLVQLIVPSLAFARVYRRNSRLFGMRTVTVSDTGIVSDHQLGHTESAWNMYEKFRETPRLFLLYQTSDIVGIVPKRAFANSADLEQFRRLIASKVRPG
ncbi:MAG TPA: YcxB family protein [Candidatus Angelobacter sp.]|nr:YcxB family protein [Candidatus Angelobacter sp.]